MAVIRQENGRPIPTKLTKAPPPTQEQILCRLAASGERIEGHLGTMAVQMTRLVDLIVEVKAEDDRVSKAVIEEQP